MGRPVCTFSSCRDPSVNGRSLDLADTSRSCSQKKLGKAPRERTLSRNNEQGGNWNVVNMTNETFEKYYKVSPALRRAHMSPECAY